MGGPFYGRGWQGVASANNGLFQTHSGVPQGTWEPGNFDYDDIKDNYLPTYTRYWHDEAQVPWLYNPATGIMISYDDPESLGIKSQYIVDNNFGGMMFWELSGDDDQSSLLTSIYDTFNPAPAARSISPDAESSGYVVLAPTLTGDQDEPILTLTQTLHPEELSFLGRSQHQTQRDRRPIREKAARLESNAIAQVNSHSSLTEEKIGVALSETDEILDAVFQEVSALEV